MKKIFLFLVLFFVNIWILSANKSENLKISETDFTPNCFEYYSEIPSNSFQESENFIYTSIYKDPIIFQWDYLLTTQFFSINKDNYNYTSDSITSFEHLNDDNENTFISIDTSKNSSITLDFWEYISDKNISLNFNYDAKFHAAEYQISADGEKYINIDDHDFSHYGFQYVRINFFRNVKTTRHEKITISELNFSHSRFDYVVKNIFPDKKIQIYASNKCKNNFSNTVYYSWLESNKDTKKIETYFEENPSLVENPENDSDDDGTLDKYDNCPIIYNPKQQDSNSNGIGDLCSDDDNDGIYGDKDNCVNTYNPDQKDINQNWVWDICEFDADKDGIFDGVDNCRNIINPDQTDTDKDNIWDACDNCSLYNPNQIDKNNNSIGDYCEATEKNLQENDDDQDKIINYKDNCRYISNNDQNDQDKDNIWDVCDNCPNIQNTKQIDKNENGIWDMCEDADNDGFIWYLDNCLHVTNVDQKDDNNNGIWNVCEDLDYDKIISINDNCPHKYNPDQSDVDNDNIWDKCDDTDDRFIESNKTLFIILFLIIVWIFGFWIVSMMKKLK